MEILDQLRQATSNCDYDVVYVAVAHDPLNGHRADIFTIVVRAKPLTVRFARAEKLLEQLKSIGYFPVVATDLPRGEYALLVTKSGRPVTVAQQSGAVPSQAQATAPVRKVKISMSNIDQCVEALRKHIEQNDEALLHTDETLIDYTFDLSSGDEANEYELEFNTRSPEHDFDGHYIATFTIEGGRIEVARVFAVEDVCRTCENERMDTERDARIAQGLR